MLLWAKKEEMWLTISFEQCSNIILEKTYSIAARPKMIAVNHYGSPKNVPKNDQDRICFYKIKDK